MLNYSVAELRVNKAVTLHALKQNKGNRLVIKSKYE